MWVYQCSRINLNLLDGSRPLVDDSEDKDKDGDSNLLAAVIGLRELRASTADVDPSKLAQHWQGEVSLTQEAIAADWRELEHVSQALQAVRGSWEALRYALEGPRADKQVLLEATKQSGKALQYASLQLRADRELMLHAVICDWKALKYAASALLADRELVLVALRQDWGAFAWVADILRTDHTFTAEATKQAWPAVLRFRAARQAAAAGSGVSGSKSGRHGRGLGIS
mmetsp:Transcript_45456/g.145890  ORF Transcript_45456/g.145890 Transcript_45456/m.145890 type:complete len:228 (+) Transcript_45456:109-792(+)